MEENRIQLLDNPESFQKLGIDPAHPAEWEDALRLQLPFKPGEYEWWYSDSHFTNGYFCMAQIILIADAKGSLMPLTSLNIAKNGEKVCDQLVPFAADQLEASAAKCDVHLSKSYFRCVDDKLKQFHVYIDPQENKGFGADLMLERTVPSFRPGTGRWDNGQGHFSWFCPLPGGNAKGKLFINGETVDVEGNTYHDHNWGDVPMAALVDNWIWGRASVGDLNIVATSTRFRADQGSLETPILYVTRGNEVLISAYNDEVVCLEGVKRPHPETGKLINGDCVYLLEKQKGMVRFQGQGAAVASFKLPAAAPGWETWYARYNAKVSFSSETENGLIEVSGNGTLENMDFFGRRIDATVNQQR